MPLIKKYKTEIIIFAVSLFAQLAPFFIWLYFHPGLLFEDKEVYWSAAKNIINHGSFSTLIYSVPDAIRPPIYPLFLGFFYLILFKSLALVLFAQNIIGAVSTVLVYRLGKDIFNRKVGIFASVMYIFEAEHLMMSSLIRSEILFTFFFLLSVIYFLRYLKYFYIRHLVYFSLLLGIATLTRPNSQLFFLVYIFIIFLMAILKKIPFKKFLFNSGLIIFIFIASILPWSARNYFKLGTLKISPIFGYNLYFNLVFEAQNTALLKQGASNKDIKARTFKLYETLAKELPAHIDEYSSVKFEKYWLDKSLFEIKKDPLLFAGAYFGCKINYFFNDASAYFLNALNRGYEDPIVNLPNFILFPLIYYGMKFIWLIIWLIIAIGLILEILAYFLRKKKDIPWIMYIFLLASIVYFALLTFCAGPLTRYRFPTNPLIFILFIHFLFVLKGAVKKYSPPKEIN